MECVLAAFAALGIFGALVISDDFDRFRWMALGYVGMPLAILYGSARILFPLWTTRSPRLGLAVVTTLFILFSTGVVPLANALGSDGTRLKRTIPLGLGLSVRDVYRGGFGWVFAAPRWWTVMMPPERGLAAAKQPMQEAHRF